MNNNMNDKSISMSIGELAESASARIRGLSTGVFAAVAATPLGAMLAESSISKLDTASHLVRRAHGALHSVPSEFQNKLLFSGIGIAAVAIGVGVLAHAGYQLYASHMEKKEVKERLAAGENGPSADIARAIVEGGGIKGSSRQLSEKSAKMLFDGLHKNLDAGRLMTLHMCQENPVAPPDVILAAFKALPKGGSEIELKDIELRTRKLSDTFSSNLPGRFDLVSDHAISLTDKMAKANEMVSRMSSLLGNSSVETNSKKLKPA